MVNVPLPAPFAHPVYVMAKPAGSMCNLACDYCYYLEKAGLYPQEKKLIMSDAMLERFIRQYIEAQTTGAVQFTWHGGEALMRVRSNFYKKAVELQKRYAAGHEVVNSIQTNGLLMTDEWCRFLRDNNWLVGISLDGPQEFHDEYRRNRNGLPSWHKVMKAVRMMQHHGVEWNALAVVNDYNADYPEEFYDFFKEIGCKYLQFTPIVERLTPHGLAAVEEKVDELAPFSVTPEQWGNFLCRVFDRWVKTDVGEQFVQIFDATLANWVGAAPGVCSMAKQCGHAGVMEYNGDLYSCDHFVFPQYKLGNIADKTIIEMMMSEKQQKFGEAKRTSLPRQCRECKFLFACNGECPKNRFAVTADGEPGLNYLCAGYKKYFAHVAPYMDFMKAELEAGRAPANIMNSPLVKK